MKRLNVLVACECSGKVREAFSALGHHAISCDIQPSDDNSPHHIQGDALKAIELMEWDLLIGFPPCTHLASSGARWFAEKRADGRQQQAIDFFMELVNAPIPHIALENPIGIMSSEYRKPNQIIQPWEFGHGETKATCLWLKNLPKLEPTDIVEGREQRIWKMGPSPDRAKKRSETYQGIADAMALQWSNWLS
jgi:site-specific DNA-cytosine methylase